jgi:hypothetical protein
MYLLLCTLNTSSGVNPASSANTEFFALGTDIIVASLIFAKQYRVKCYADVKIF